MTLDPSLLKITHRKLVMAKKITKILFEIFYFSSGFGFPGRGLQLSGKIQVRENLEESVYLLFFPDLCMILPLPETDHPGDETKTVDPCGPGFETKNYL
jgi:hypothetical protein